MGHTCHCSSAGSSRSSSVTQFTQGSLTLWPRCKLPGEGVTSEGHTREATLLETLGSPFCRSLPFLQLLPWSAIAGMHVPCLASVLFVAGSLPRAAADNVLVRAWGKNTVRVQVAPASYTLTDTLPTAYLPGGAPGGGDGGFGTQGFGSALPSVAAGPVISGNIKATQGADGMLTFTRLSDSKVLLRESSRTFSTPASGADSSVTFDFSSSATKLYGMGQNRQDQNGPGVCRTRPPYLNLNHRFPRVLSGTLSDRYILPNGVFRFGAQRRRTVVLVRKIYRLRRGPIELVAMGARRRSHHRFSVRLPLQLAGDGWSCAHGKKYDLVDHRRRW